MPASTPAFRRADGRKLMLTPGEFEDLLADGGKRIEGDIVWAPDSRHPGAMAFRAEVVSDAGYPLFVAGWHNPRMGKLSYALIHRQVGRIYALGSGRRPS